MIVNQPPAVVFPGYPSAMVPAYPAATPAYPSAQVPAYNNGIFDGLTLAAWALFLGASGTIVEASNVSGVTRSSAGLYTVNFAAAMANTSYFTDIKLNHAAVGAMQSTLDSYTQSKAVGNTVIGTKLATVATDVTLIYVAVYA